MALVAGVALLAAAQLVPRVDDTWARDPGLQRAYELGYTTVVGRSHTVHGAKLTVERAYADPFRIAVGFTIADDQNRHVRVRPELVGLEDSLGRRFDGLTQHGYADGRSPYGAQVATFDGSALPDELAHVNLTLVIPSVELAGQSVSGPWRVQFVLPITRVRTTRTEITLTSDMSMTVEAGSAPSETRVNVVVRDPLGRPWSPHRLHIEVNGTAYEPTSFQCDRRGACTRFSFLNGSSPTSGWTVIIENLITRDGGGVTGVWRVQVAPQRQ